MAAQNDVDAIAHGVDELLCDACKARVAELFASMMVDGRKKRPVTPGRVARPEREGRRSYYAIETDESGKTTHFLQFDTRVERDAYVDEGAREPGPGYREAISAMDPELRAVVYKERVTGATIIRRPTEARRVSTVSKSI